MYLQPISNRGSLQIAAILQANGGKILEPKMAIPGIGWYATCTEPGGLIFGIIEADPSVDSI